MIGMLGISCPADEVAGEVLGIVGQLRRQSRPSCPVGRRRVATGSGWRSDANRDYGRHKGCQVGMRANGRMV